MSLRQLLGGGSEFVATKMVEAPAFAETTSVLTTMRALQDRRLQMAIVFNEHGAVSGIVTMEDLVEELVGEIYDEADPETAVVRREPDGTAVVPGRYLVHHLAELGIPVPEGRYATVAGLALDRLQRVPTAGAEFDVAGFVVEVREMKGHAIAEVAMRPAETDGAIPTISSPPGGRVRT